MPEIGAVHSTSKIMSDKNPKAKRKMEQQHKMQKQQKSEAYQREQQRIQEIHMLKHPHEQNG